METTKIMQHLIGKTYAEVTAALRIESDDGYCCGWADCEVTDHVQAIHNSANAKLQDVVQIDYSDDYSSRVVVNFIFDIGGGEGVILGYDMEAGSGSGWTYGASCTLMYGEEEVANASW